MNIVAFVQSCRHVHRSTRDRQLMSRSFSGALKHYGAPSAISTLQVSVYVYYENEGLSGFIYDFSD